MLLRHRTREQTMRARNLVFCLVAISGAVAARPAGALTPPIPPFFGSFRVQPGGVVLACGGFVGDCRTFTLEGSLFLEQIIDTVRIAESDLRLRNDLGVIPFPGSSDLPLVGLSGTIEIVDGTRRIALAADGQHGQRAALELVDVGTFSNPIGTVRLALVGTYDEGCCDRFVYSFGNVKLEPELHDGLALGLPESPRFVVDVSWAPGDGTETRAVPERLGANLGYFWFFSSDNPEIFVKIVDACDTRWGRVWFFASGLTNLGVRIVVTDRSTGLTKTYFNAVGSPFASIQDTGGFPCGLAS
jgi:hypothetical protein